MVSAAQLLAAVECCQKHTLHLYFSLGTCFFRVGSFQIVVSEGSLGSCFCFEIQDFVNFKVSCFSPAQASGLKSTVYSEWMSASIYRFPATVSIQVARQSLLLSFPACLQQDSSRRWDLAFHCIPTLVSISQLQLRISPLLLLGVKREPSVGPCTFLLTFLCSFYVERHMHMYMHGHFVSGNHFSFESILLYNLPAYET